MPWKPKNAVYIKLPHMDKNYSLCIEHESKELCTTFKRFCRWKMPEELKWFLQFDCQNFKMFECWVDFEHNTDKQDLLFEFGEKVAQKLGLEFDIC